MEWNFSWLPLEAVSVELWTGLWWVEYFRCDLSFHKYVFCHVYNNFFFLLLFLSTSFLSIETHRQVGAVNSQTLINQNQSLYLFKAKTFLTYFLGWLLRLSCVYHSGPKLSLTLCVAWWIPLPSHFPQGVKSPNPRMTIPCFPAPSFRHSWVEWNLLCDASM